MVNMMCVNPDLSSGLTVKPEAFCRASYAFTEVPAVFSVGFFASSIIASVICSHSDLGLSGVTWVRS
jgi:hypothetical protein